MALPEDWNNVRWGPNLVILPQSTEGYPTVPINRHLYPQYPRGYFMLAFINEDGHQAIGYDAADVGAAGQLVSEFVIWHEIGHHVLGHTSNLPPGEMEGIQYTDNRELDADQYAFNHWIDRNDWHGLQVVAATIAYLRNQGNAPGDAAHPSPATRCGRLLMHVQARQICSFTIQNDPITSRQFVLEVLFQCFGFEWFKDAAHRLIGDIERNGSMILASKANGRLIERNEASKITNFVQTKMRLAGQMHFNMTCQLIQV